MYLVTPPSRPLIKVLNNVAASTNPWSTLLFTSIILKTTVIHHEHHLSRANTLCKLKLFCLNCAASSGWGKREEMSSVSGGRRWNQGWWCCLKPLLIKEFKRINGEKCDLPLHPAMSCSRGLPDALVWQCQRPHTWGRNYILSQELLHQPVHNRNSSHWQRGDTLCSHRTISSKK